MPRFQKIKLKEIKEKIQRTARRAGEKAFLFFLLLFFIALLIGSLIFYRYTRLIKRVEFELPAKTAQFDETVYQAVLQKIEEREKRFQEADLKTYPDPFAVPVTEVAETTEE